MGQRGIKSILLNNEHLHLEALCITFWANGSVLGMNAD
jgi:hypothetical protein